ncbi:GDSL esterase/lipase At5g45960-like [Neltuma alba]|uniref:GDSL esterase/lipase At5g45960-like n=1 Tax=Neltuma alba TaxID=207710 RepID=UPI0010A35E6A|nr:GDSL esterase/lipase At5g45960-like [Prosopis alba]
MRTYEDTHVSVSLPMKCFIACLQLCLVAKSVGSSSSSKNVSGLALYIFGDSTVDPGNNNNINTALKSNFPPYGRDLPSHVPSGRFTNGKLATDYIASYAGVKKEFMPPYLDSRLDMEELMSGVSFASAGSGFDLLTPALSNVIPIPKQLQYFREYKKRLESAVGRERTETHIQKSAFLVSAATNDFVVNYFLVPFRSQNFSVFTYQQFLVQQIKSLLQDLLGEGAREIAVVGLPPMGCLPIMMTLNSFGGERSCIDKYSLIARDYNQILQRELRLMQQRFSNSGAHFYYVDIYGPLADMIQAPHKYGFDEVNNGCCGSGYVETSFLCNDKLPVCSDASKYVFWDSIHPTDKAYHYIFLAAQSTVDFILQRLQQRH